MLTLKNLALIFGQNVLLPLYVHCERHVIQLRSSKIRIENASVYFFCKSIGSLAWQAKQ